MKAKRALSVAARRTVRLLLAGLNTTPTYVVVGMRRSGNHAIINWLATRYTDSVLERDSTYRHLNVSSDGKLLFLNEFNTLGTKNLIWMTCHRWNRLRQASAIIVSFEDTSVSDAIRSSPVRARYVKNVVVVQRSLLNVAASRLQLLRRRAYQGRGISGLNVDRKFCEAWIDHQVQQDGEFVQLSFDSWLTEEGRAEYAKKLGILGGEVAISHQGGGSSFSGTASLPSSDALGSRFVHFDFGPDVTALLSSEQLRPHLTAAEAQFLRGLHHRSFETEIG
ncbi:MAG: hypothetical protein HKN91_05970 [Acidimicrobiia bacterium]|nr:hypothetical protein [Acidimicrobiia bacterium]